MPLFPLFTFHLPLSSFHFPLPAIRRLRLFLIALPLLTLPLLAQAEDSTALLLGNESEQKQWSTSRLNGVLPLPNGIRIFSSAPGAITRSLALPHSVDVIEIMYVSRAGGTLSFVWRKPNTKSNQYYQIPITLKPGSSSQTFTLVPGAVGNWTSHPAAIGFQIPAGVDVTFNTVTLRGWSRAEKLAEAIRCFWTPDTLMAHSINFFWGPLLCSSPQARENLYRSQPPVAHSGMRVLYGILIIGTLVFALQRWRAHGRWRKGTFLRRMLLLTLGLWIILDIRMGAEFLRNWKIDLDSYLTKPVGQRVFRTIRFLPDFATASLGVLSDQPRYVLLSPSTVTIMNFMHYQTYPSVPTAGPEEGSGASLWLVYDRPDLAIDAQGRIVEDGAPLSPPGSVVHEFMKGTFIFRVKPVSPS